MGYSVITFAKDKAEAKKASFPAYPSYLTELNLFFKYMVSHLLFSFQFLRADRTQNSLRELACLYFLRFPDNLLNRHKPHSLSRQGSLSSQSKITGQRKAKKQTWLGNKAWKTKKYCYLRKWKQSQQGPFLEAFFPHTSAQKTATGAPGFWLFALGRCLVQIEPVWLKHRKQSSIDHRPDYFVSPQPSRPRSNIYFSSKCRIPLNTFLISSFILCGVVTTSPPQRRKGKGQAGQVRMTWDVLLIVEGVSHCTGGHRSKRASHSQWAQYQTKNIQKSWTWLRPTKFKCEQESPHS